MKKITLLLLMLCLFPVNHAMSQDALPDWHIAYDSATGQLITFTLQEGTAQVVLDETLPQTGDGIFIAYRLGPQESLFIYDSRAEDTRFTYHLTPAGLRDVSALINWDTVGDLRFYSQSRLVFFDQLAASITVVGLQDDQIQTFTPVDIPGPRLSTDGQFLRFVAADSAWDVMEMDLATGSITPLNLFSIPVGGAGPLIGADEFGEVWVQRATQTTPAELVWLDGTREILQDPDTTNLTYVLILNRQVFHFDYFCEVQCVAHARPLNGDTFATYLLPTNGTILPISLVGDTLFITDPLKQLWAIAPESNPRLLGYLSEQIPLYIDPQLVWSPDRQIAVFGEAVTFPTTVHVWDSATATDLFTFEAETVPRMHYATAGIVFEGGETAQFYRQSDGTIFPLPSPEAAVLDGWTILPDATLLYSSRAESEGVWQAYHYDPATETDSLLFDGMRLAELRPLGAP